MPLTPGFNLQEAAPLISMLAALEGTTPPPLQQPPFPGNWKIIFDSQSIGPFDNRWQLAQSTDDASIFAILIRGTTYAAGSILDDLLAVMIPANGSITVNFDGFDQAFSYQLAATSATAQSPEAGVHLGFALSTLVLMLYPPSGILWQLPLLVPENSSIFIAGHSQGAAIATLATSYLHYGSNWSLIPYNFAANTYKTYAFSQPKPGNDIYGDDYDSIASNQGMAFTVTNTQDWVPQVPLTFELPSNVNTPNPLSVLGGSQMFLGTLADDVETLSTRAAAVHSAKQAPQMAMLKAVLTDQRVQKIVAPGRTPVAATAASSIKFPPILFTLNFAGCGSPYVLTGVAGTNPCCPGDFFWQHHGAMYYDLLEGIAIPTTCT